jgi:uncharacterized protein (DUF488 family)
MLHDYRKASGIWPDYERRFLSLMAERGIETLDRRLFDGPTVLLCSEHTATHCHRRLVLEYLKGHWKDLTVTHL